MAEYENVPSGRNASTSQLPTIESFRRMVIERFQLAVDGRVCDYQSYLALPEGLRHGDEANAVDQRFALSALEWLGFSGADWVYNQPQAGQKAKRPDYLLKGAVGTAFIWEDKNSTLDLDEKHLIQMRQYCVGTAGYALWCNMRRMLAIRFAPTESLKYDVLADVAVEKIFAEQLPLPTFLEEQETQLALLRLLFGKERFTQFEQLLANISVPELAFAQNALALDEAQTIQHFIDGSKELLDHLRLAALAHVQEALASRSHTIEEETRLQQDWQRGRDELLQKLGFHATTGLEKIVQPLVDALAHITANLGQIEPHVIEKVEEVFESVVKKGMGRVTPSVRANYEKWLDNALSINSTLLALRFNALEPLRISNAYQLWSERQSDLEDVRPEVFAEQIAYVFFVRLLLVRVLEDKGILRPRILSNGGFLEWSNYIKRHVQEVEGVGILNESYSIILAYKASRYYMHFYHQAVFDWFIPDDFLFVESLDFLSRYNFQRISSDIIGFTYEEYIDRNARNRKGHFLTRGEVVDYMLDMLEYSGPQVIGRSIFDPACGSGSFLVHAARRYRSALVTYFCTLHGVANEEQLATRPEWHKELAIRYLEDLTSLFYGSELNPFACYLAEMNLLIQGMDDLVMLQQAGETRSIDRFHIYNTDSLDLPYEIRHGSKPAENAQSMLASERLYYLVDETYPMKMKRDEFAQGFFYIISNPPYVSSKQERINVRRYRNAEFYQVALSGDTNLYLLFLRLGMYYLSDYGQMIFIMPLTLFGDRSARAARKMLKTSPFSPDLVTRFYRGDILFPGVDQAVGVIRVRHSYSNPSILVSGGTTIEQARANQFSTHLANVIDVVPENGVWHGNWLVADSQMSLDIWQHAKKVSNDLTFRLESLLDEAFERKQGDVNATIVNPLRYPKGSFADGSVAIYKGEDIRAFAPIPTRPSDWAKPLAKDAEGKALSDVLRASQTLEQLKQLQGKEVGIVMREVARLNTRERLIATWFERDARTPSAFSHQLWRMLLKPDTSTETARALLACITSKTIAYLLNLFSANNHVMRDDLSRIPIPDPQTFPAVQLAELTQQLLMARGNLEQGFVVKYQARLPRFADGQVMIAPSAVLAQTRLPKLTLQSLLGRGEVRNNGPVNGRIRSLYARGLIVCTMPDTQPNVVAFTSVLNLFLSERGREQETWEQAQSWQLPDPVAATAWLAQYDTINQQAQELWEQFGTLQQQVDEVVADWYGFTAPMRAAIAAGLPWARRQQDEED